MAGVAILVGVPWFLLSWLAAGAVLAVGGLRRWRAGASGGRTASAAAAALLVPPAVALLAMVLIIGLNWDGRDAGTWDAVWPWLLGTGCGGWLLSQGLLVRAWEVASRPDRSWPPGPPGGEDPARPGEGGG